MDRAKEKASKDAAKRKALQLLLEKAQLPKENDGGSTTMRVEKKKKKKEFEVKFAKPITIDRDVPFDYEEDKVKNNSRKAKLNATIPDAGADANSNSKDDQEHANRQTHGLFNFNAMDIEFKNFFNDGTLLEDLNSLATEILDDISISPSSSVTSFTHSEISCSGLIDPLDTEFTATTQSAASTIYKPWDQINIPEILSQFTALPLTHQADLKTFLTKISSFLFPFNQGLMVAILTKHASYCKYLLYAMLSLASNHPGYKKQYLSICFKSMKDTFENSDHENQTESLILAILLLATDSTSKDWKFHLRGAKDIVLKVIRNKKLVLSPGLMLAKSWFIAIEILARLEGIGITTSEDELEELLNYESLNAHDQIHQGFNQLQIAVDIGLLLPSGYDLFLGYSKELLDFYKYFFHLQSLAQINHHSCFQMNNDQLVHLFSLAQHSQSFQIISKDIIIPQSSPYHPSNPSTPAQQVRDSCLGNNHQTGTVFSWLDLVHQLHALSLTIRTYLQFLPFQTDSYIIQELLTKMINLCHFYTISANLSLDDEQPPSESDLERYITIAQDEDSRLLLLQGPMIQMGVCCIDPVQKYKITLYFKTLIKLGVPSAMGSLERLNSAWNGTREGFSSLDSADGNCVVPFA